MQIRSLLLPGVWAMLLSGAASSMAVAPSPGLLGDWSSPDNAIVRLYSCGPQICLKIVKLSPTIPEKKDAKNPKTDLRDRPLCGLDIGTGFRQVDAQHLADGQVYDPESGHTYSGTIAIDGDELKLRGFIGISLLGRTEVWHRATAVQAECR